MFISEAYAQTAAPAGMDLLQMAPIIVMFALLYFLMIRPQMKRQKEHQSMLSSLKKGDEVVAAGILGKVVEVGEAYVSVEIARNSVIQVQKSAITTLLPNGTIKAAS